jgi:hypothetical protein
VVVARPSLGYVVAVAGRLAVLVGDNGVIFLEVAIAESALCFSVKQGREMGGARMVAHHCCSLSLR